MATIILELTPALADKAGLDIRSTLEADTLAGALRGLTERIPFLEGLDQPRHAIHRRIRIYLNQLDIHQLDIHQLTLVEGDHIALVPLTTII